LNNNHSHFNLICLLLFCFLANNTIAQETHPFESSSRCIACHSNIKTDEDHSLSIGYDWRSSMMANAAIDPYWQAGVRRETLIHPEHSDEIQDICATCHMPMYRYSQNLQGMLANVFEVLSNQDTYDASLAIDGVSCLACHQMSPEHLGEEASYSGQFKLDIAELENDRYVYGPYDINEALMQVMRSSSSFVPQQGTHIRSSELCASCHTLFTDTLDASGNVIGVFPEQTPYIEWLESSYKDTQSCQSCHMPEHENVPITSVLGESREILASHGFVGSNAFMLEILANNREQLNVRATENELNRHISDTINFLQNESATIQIENIDFLSGFLSFDIRVENLAGHKLPTAYPSRRAWLHILIADELGNIIFQSGEANPDGSITGNINDFDPEKYEPHYEIITQQDEVQIYEPILIDEYGNITTSLLSALSYAKDNRLLPRGIYHDNKNQAINPKGNAKNDQNFSNGMDITSFSVAIPAAINLRIFAELLYQPIGYRWAENHDIYRSDESNRFLTLYRENSNKSYVTLSSDSIDISNY